MFSVWVWNYAFIWDLNLKRLINGSFVDVKQRQDRGCLHANTYPLLQRMANLMRTRFIQWEDHKRLIKTLVEQVKGGVEAIAGCSGINTDDFNRRKETRAMWEKQGRRQVTQPNDKPVSAIPPMMNDGVSGISLHVCVAGQVVWGVRYDPPIASLSQ